MEHKTPGTGPLRCLSLGRDAGGGQSYTLTPQRVCVAPQPFARASPVYDRLCPRVCCWVERGRSDLCGCKPEPGGGGSFREPGWDGTSWGSLNHIGAAMGRLPGAWRAEREAHASDLSAPPPFDLLASLERLPPPHLGAVAGGLARGASSWPGAVGFANAGMRRKLLSLLRGLAGLVSQSMSNWPGSPAQRCWAGSRAPRGLLAPALPP